MQRLCLPANLWHQFSEVQSNLSIRRSTRTCDPQSRASQLNASDRPLKRNSLAVAMFMRRTFDFVLRPIHRVYVV
jgi:hypothetical protein